MSLAPDDSQEEAFGRAEPLHARTYDLLWQRLESGELAAGARLKDTDWAARLGVSRTPVREALRKLAHDGALDPLGVGGYQVHRFSAGEIAELYRCRAALEALAAEEAARRGGAALSAVLEANVAAAGQALEAGDLEALQQLNGAFHDAVLEAAESPYVMRLLEQIRRLVRMARRQLLARAMAGAESHGAYREGLVRVLADHVALHGAIAASDGARAGALMRSHLLATARDMGAVLDSATLLGDAA
jgi:DNA-binding GntR family transcriptional regulator